MRTIIVAVVLAGALTAGTIAVGWTNRSSAQEQIAPLVHRKGTRLADLTRPRAVGGAKLIVVEKDASPPMQVEPPRGAGDLEFLSSIVSVVALVKVTGLEPVLTADQDWVTTTVRVTVEEVVKKPIGDSLAAKDSITFQQDGGEIRIGAARVRAVLPFAELMENGKRYLLFGLRDPADGSLYFDPMHIFQISANDDLMPGAKVGPWRSPAGVKTEDALKRVRAAKGGQ